MIFNTLYFLIVIILQILNNIECFNFGYVGEAAHYAKCLITECCGDKYIIGDLRRLRSTLDKQLFGQNLAKEVVLNAIRAHWENDFSQKALTLSFHGPPGTGKNYVSRMIVDSLYKEGSKSQYVHHFQGRIQFPKEDQADIYKENIYLWIKGNITKCEKQLFIFDEVDKMPSAVLNGIKPIIDYHDTVEKVDYRKSIFIFLSNTGSSLINDHYISLWKSGKKRRDIKLKDFEKLIAAGAFNEKGGFHHSDTIKCNLIDHYIPFLPLEYDHVRSCIYTEFSLRGVSHFQERDILEVLEGVEWGPSPENLFSKTGCKRLSQKVAMITQKNYAPPLNDEL
nr:torsin-1A-like [Onthophagus taurus]